MAAELGRYAGRDDVVVMALPRGGVAVGYEVARALAAPLDVLVVRKLGVPGHEELSAGALASGGACVMNTELINLVPSDVLERAVRRSEREIMHQERLYRGDRPQTSLEGRIAILVDDGLVTGATMRAGVLAVRNRQPAKVVVAAPVGSRTALAALSREADDLVCPLAPEPLGALSAWYGDFRQVDDAALRELLDRAWSRSHSHTSLPKVSIDDSDGAIDARLALPRHATGVVIAWGEASTLAAALNDAGIGLIALNRAPSNGALERAMCWSRTHHPTTYLGIGLFGSGAAANGVLSTAAHRPDMVNAIVVQSARLEPSVEAELSHVYAPTLLIAGTRDEGGLAVSRHAATAIHAPRMLECVVGASESFEEPGTADEAARLATDWFRHYL